MHCSPYCSSGCGDGSGSQVDANARQQRLPALTKIAAVSDRDKVTYHRQDIVTCVLTCMNVALGAPQRRGIAGAVSSDSRRPA